MDRRKFVNLTAGAAAGFIAGQRTLHPTGLSSSPSAWLAFSAPSSSAARKLIIPTDTPDRFKAKVMEFNPVPAIDPATWQLQIGGLVEQPLKLNVADVSRFLASSRAAA
jgi:DMSO/TMAO reductase YedYZ molybdopterin-dependent catalytic subunit